MLYAISRGNVPAYQDGQNPLVYLVTDTHIVILQARDHY